MIENKKLVVVIFTMFISIRSMPLPNIKNTQRVPDNSSLTSAMMYLMRYGYMDLNKSSGKSAPLLSMDYLKNHIMEFQAFAGINQTGELNDETIMYMNMPRCGVKDIVGKGANARKKRYALQGSRWRVKNLSYKISQYPSTSRLTKSDVDNEIKKALEVWSEHTDLKFEQKNSGKVHIDIRFEEGEHGDGDPFDGSGGTLAHAFFPVYGGDAHFDDDEYWTINSFRGTNLVQTAAHEFGHSLGLSHSDTNSALMAPFYRGYRRNVQLGDDDIEAIQALYGEKRSKTRTTTTRKPITVRNGIFDEDVNDNELCNDADIDAIITVKDKVTYAFKGSNYWKLTEDSIAPGYPRKITKDWDGLPSNIDAAFTWKNGKSYFFKGSKYWRFTNRNMDNGYPKSISRGFEGIPDNVDASFVWTGNGKIYFFKNDEYWRFDPEARPPVKNSYPKSISNWEGIPNDIDAALQYTNGYTYFFKDGKYWRFDDRKFTVDKADPEFPRPAGFWWFGCTTESSNQGKTNNSKNGGGGSDGDGKSFQSDRSDVPPKTPNDSDMGDEDLDAELTLNNIQNDRGLKFYQKDNQEHDNSHRKPHNFPTSSSSESSLKGIHNMDTIINYVLIYINIVIFTNVIIKI